MGRGSDDVTLFENHDWRLSASGLEHKAVGYVIEADRVGDRRRDGSWSWPNHMAEKLWCEPRFFEEAFAQALVVFGHAPNGLRTGSRTAPQTARPSLEDGNMPETAPRRLGAIAAGRLAALHEQAAEARRQSRVEVDHGPRDGVGSTERPMRRAA